jgi:hypothetical protein
MPPAEFEPAIPAREQPQTHALDRAATGTGGICQTALLTFQWPLYQLHIIYIRHDYFLKVTSM